MVPVATVHVGWVTVTVGAAGDPGTASITTSADEGEVHPAALVTVKLCVPVDSNDIVVPEPVPVIVPGLIVQLPAGKPFNTTLPVPTAHVGWVMAPTVGDAGTVFTVNVYVATAAAHGDPKGLFVATVIITLLPASPVAGV